MKAELLKPIKAPNEQIPFSDKRIKYPMLASIKYDGFRGILMNGVFYSPALKKHPNVNLLSHFSEIINHADRAGVVFDGELWHPNLTFDQLSSRMRKHDGSMEGFEYHIFDCMSVAEWNLADLGGRLYFARNGELGYVINVAQFPNVKHVKQTVVLNADAASEMYAAHLAAGHEGMMLRSANGRYKHNRCTHNESNLYKFKHFETIDAKIVGIVQRRKMRADVERTYDPVGGLAKVNTQDSYELDEALGALTVQLADGRKTDINLGRGYTYADRVSLWKTRENLVGKMVEFKWMPHGTKNLPRIGSVVRFRPDLD